jgi:hypothetical protein
MIFCWISFELVWQRFKEGVVRNLKTVIDRMISEVPPGEIRGDQLPTLEEDFVEQLQRLRESVSVAAPEMMAFWWREVQQALVDCIPHDDVSRKEWHEMVLAIWEDRIE